jgi:hypothetical protein
MGITGTPRPTLTSMRNDTGVVLVFTVLLGLAMLALGHGLLVTAQAGYATARSGARLVRVRAVADGLVLGAMQRGPNPWRDSVLVGGGRSTSATPTSGDSTVTTWRRLSVEAWTIEGVAVSPAGVRAASTRLVWSPDARARIDALAATVLLGRDASVTGGGPIDGSDAPAIGFVDAPDLGLLLFDDVRSRATPIGPVGTPAPRVAAGLCVEADAWNWGSPDRPDETCGDYFATSAATGSSTVEGGVGQALLLTDGDLTLRGGVRLYGLVLVRGRLRILDGSVFTGMVIALGGVEIDPTSRIISSRAWAFRVLDGVDIGAGPFKPLHPAARLGPG